MGNFVTSLNVRVFRDSSPLQQSRSALDFIDVQSRLKILWNTVRQAVTMLGDRDRSASQEM
jgi:Ca2+-binding EF-hand superfamily protein